MSSSYPSHVETVTSTTDAGFERTSVCFESVTAIISCSERNMEAPLPDLTSVSRDSSTDKSCTSDSSDGCKSDLFAVGEIAIVLVSCLESIALNWSLFGDLLTRGGSGKVKLDASPAESRVEVIDRPPFELVMGW